MSEFGKGFSYCLGLFLSHSERDCVREKSEHYKPDLWFYGANDHLYELQIPMQFSMAKIAEIEKFVSKCYQHSIGEIVTTWDDVQEAIKSAKGFLLDWDRQMGVPCEKGDYE